MSWVRHRITTLDDVSIEGQTFNPGLVHFIVDTLYPLEGARAWVDETEVPVTVLQSWSEAYRQARTEVRVAPDGINHGLKQATDFPGGLIHDNWFIQRTDGVSKYIIARVQYQDQYANNLIITWNESTLTKTIVSAAPIANGGA